MWISVVVVHTRTSTDGVHCISPSDELLGKVLVPELVSIVCFGERHGSTLFITATTSVYDHVRFRHHCTDALLASFPRPTHNNETLRLVPGNVG